MKKLKWMIDINDEEIRIIDEDTTESDLKQNYNEPMDKNKIQFGNLSEKNKYSS